METEELLRSYPADGCVLMGGCDKTTPALVMGALSMNLPAIFLPAGPMLPMISNLEPAEREGVKAAASALLAHDRALAREPLAA